MLLRCVMEHAKTMNWTTIAFLFAIVGVSGCASQSAPVDLLVENITIYRGDGSDAFVGSIAIREGKFVAVAAPDVGHHEALETLDGTGKFAMPGLWDAHVHMRSATGDGLDASHFLSFGVTSVHDLGGYLEPLKILEAQIHSNPEQGPHIYPAYFMLNGESFAGFQQSVTTEEEVTRAIEELASAGAAQIKIHRALSPDLAPFVFDTAQQHGLTVTGHIPLGMHPTDACEAGMKGVEHVGSFIEAFVSVASDENKNAQAGLDYMLSDAASTLIDCLVSNGVAVTPTLVIYPSIAKRRSDGGGIPQQFVDFIQQTNEIAKRLHDAGVMLVSGTDTSDFEETPIAHPGAALHEELNMMESAGIEPTAIIKIATLNSARAIGVDSTTGSIAESKDADFLILSKDPGKTISNLATIVAVFRDGKVVFNNPD